MFPLLTAAAGLLLVLSMNVIEQRDDEPATDSLHVMSFNIRFDNPHDGRHAWPHRRQRVREVIRFHEIDLLGVQEALEHQVRELGGDLEGFAWVGAGRADGEDGGEFSALYYRKSRFELLDSGTFWLSPTPDEPGSKGWDAALPRIATWAKLRDRGTGRELIAFNTHFDHAGREARRQSARLLVERAGQMAGKLPVIILGDFNAEPDSETYQTLAESFEDARELSETGHFGPNGTFGTFEPRERPALRIDYIFVSRGTRVLREATLAHHWDGLHASDHWPIYAEIVLPEQ